MTTYRLTFITPLFSKGCYDDLPEIRPPSIRGQLRWWFRVLGGKPEEENMVFGSVHSRPVLASKIIVRVSNIEGVTGEYITLPHKHGGKAAPKWAYAPGTSFELHLVERLGGLNRELTRDLDQAVQAWLLMGTLGLRATRAAGSFTWQSCNAEGIAAPTTEETYSARCSGLLKKARLRFAVLPRSFKGAEDARRVVSDTLGGKEHFTGAESMRSLRNPLGKALGGRKTSPLRFRIIKLHEGYYITALWDARSEVTGNQERDLADVIGLLSSKNKSIGELLKESSII